MLGEEDSWLFAEHCTSALRSVCISSLLNAVTNCHKRQNNAFKQHLYLSSYSPRGQKPHTGLLELTSKVPTALHFSLEALQTAPFLAFSSFSRTPEVLGRGPFLPSPSQQVFLLPDPPSDLLSGLPLLHLKAWAHLAKPG